MEYNGLPQKQGLYDPQFEHDACGIGFIANIKGRTSHGIINQAIQILKNLAPTPTPETERAYLSRCPTYS